MGNSINSTEGIWKRMKVCFVLFCLIVTEEILLAFRVQRLLNKLIPEQFCLTGYPTQNAQTYSIVKQAKIGPYAHG